MSRNARRFVSAFTSPTSAEENTSRMFDSTALASGSAVAPNARNAKKPSPAPAPTTSSLRTEARCMASALHNFGLAALVPLRVVAGTLVRLGARGEGRQRRRHVFLLAAAVDDR